LADPTQAVDLLIDEAITVIVQAVTALLTALKITDTKALPKAALQVSRATGPCITRQTLISQPSQCFIDLSITVVI